MSTLDFTKNLPLVPTLGEYQGCFDDLKFFYYDNQKEIPSIFKPFEEKELSFSQFNERDDYLKYPIVIIPKGTELCHATPVSRFYNERVWGEKETLFNYVDYLWYTKYYPSTKCGGWFTRGCTYVRDRYVSIIYELKEDIPLILLPDDTKSLFWDKNPEYYPLDFIASLNNENGFLNFLRTEEVKTFGDLRKIIYIFDLPECELFQILKKIIIFDSREIPDDSKLSNEINNVLDSFIMPKLISIGDTEAIESLKKGGVKSEKYSFQQSNLLLDYIYGDVYSGSHIFLGPKDWKKKGYPQIMQPPSADGGLGERVNTLGLMGYLSSDLCEIFISQDVMHKFISHPIDIRATQETITSIPISLGEFSLKNKNKELTFKDENEFLGYNYVDYDLFNVLKGVDLPEKEKVDIIRKIQGEIKPLNREVSKILNDVIIQELENYSSELLTFKNAEVSPSLSGEEEVKRKEKIHRKILRKIKKILKLPTPKVYEGVPEFKLWDIISKHLTAAGDKKILEKTFVYLFKITDAIEWCKIQIKDINTLIETLKKQMEVKIIDLTTFKIDDITLTIKGESIIFSSSLGEEEEKEDSSIKCALTLEGKNGTVPSFYTFKLNCDKIEKIFSNFNARKESNLKEYKNYVLRMSVK